MTTFTGISPQASVFGTEQSEGIIVAKTDQVDAPGGIVFGTNNAGTMVYNFLWVDTTGDLRITNCTIGTGTVAVYDPGTNQMTFASFDQDGSGTVVGSQS